MSDNSNIFQVAISGITLLVIVVAIFVAFYFWYTQYYCPNNFDNGMVCERNCQCSSNQCALQLGSGNANPKSCCSKTVVYNGQEYCGNLGTLSPCLSNEMCASGVCSSTTAGIGVCMPAGTPPPDPNPIINPNGNIPRGSPCTSTSQCVPGQQGQGVTVCGPSTSDSNSPKVCCQGLEIEGYAFCTDFKPGASCYIGVQCASRSCVNGICQ